VSASETARILETILSTLSPHLPAGVRITITARHHTVELQRVDGTSGEVAGLRASERRTPDGRIDGGNIDVSFSPNLRPRLPLPKSLRARLTAGEAVETVLQVAYEDRNPEWFKDPKYSRHHIDFKIKTTTTPDGIEVSYQAPGATDRVKLSPIPLSEL
jgi:hypothetical protein